MACVVSLPLPAVFDLAGSSPKRLIPKSKMCLRKSVVRFFHKRRLFMKMNRRFWINETSVTNIITIAATFNVYFY